MKAIAVYALPLELTFSTEILRVIKNMELCHRTAGVVSRARWWHLESTRPAEGHHRIGWNGSCTYQM